MKPNTYVKIVSSGIANPVEELMPFIQGEEIMPLQEDESVEVRSSVLNEGNIIIFRNRKSREVLSVIHTPHTVYIQEQNKTISTHRPYSSFLFGMDNDGKLEPVAELFKIKVDDRFYATASEELNDVAAWVLSVLEQITPSVIEMAIEFDRFNLPCRTNVGLEEAFGLLNEALQSNVGYMLLPVKSGPGRHAIDYFYLEPVPGATSVELKAEVTFSGEITVNDGKGSTRQRDLIIPHPEHLSHQPLTDLTMGGQMGSCPKPDADDARTWLLDPDTKMPVHPDSSQGIALYNAIVNQGS